MRLRTGVGRIFTTDREKFERTIREYLQRNFDIITDSLPFPMFSRKTETLDPDSPNPIEIVISRTPYSRV